MAEIRFDALVPRQDIARLEERFRAALEVLTASGRLQRGTVRVNPEPPLVPGVGEQLRETYREDHEGEDMPDAAVVRYAVDARGVEGSVNQLTMALSRLLTPQARLPRDRVLLENERAYEMPARYPWSVEILR